MLIDVAEEFYGNDSVFQVQQDNAATHTARNTKEYDELACAQLRS